MKHPVLFASDLHGNRFAYDRLFRFAAEKDIRTVILGGDLTPKWPVLEFGRRGAIVPLLPALFRQDGNRFTYTEFLHEVARANEMQRVAAERYYVNLGGYLVYGQEQILWEDMLAEQHVLKRIIDEFRPSSLTGSAFILSEKEWTLLEPMLREAMEQRTKPIDSRRLLAALRMHTMTADDKRAVVLAIARVKESLASAVGQPCAQQYLSMLREALSLFEGGEMQTSLGDIDATAQLAASNHPLNQEAEKRSRLELAIQPQITFLEQYLNKRIREYLREVPGGKIYFILGNDDVIETEPIAKKMAARGIATYISNDIVPLYGDVKIAGYSSVPNSRGRFYAGWEKSEEDIEQDMHALEARAEGDRVVYAVHCPPAVTSLDVAWKHAHYGSIGVRNWLRASPKYAVFSGHIHETPFLPGGSWRETIDGTPCFQPGGWHDEGLCAIVFDADNPADAEWIHDPSKIRKDG